MKPNSNWMRLKPKVEKDKKGQGSLNRSKNKAFVDNNKGQTVINIHSSTQQHPTNNINEGYIPECVQLAERVHEKLQSNYIALDCEMVGIGLKGKQSALARCCLVDFNGNKVYDEFVRPPGFVTDFRTKWSGIRRQDLRHGLAVSLSDCQTAVAKLLKDKVLVGHALKNDMSVLMLSHPRRMIRDTATHRPLMRSHGTSGKYRPRSLRDLSKEHLSITIQTGEHDPGEDARSAMMLYRLHRKTWESSLRTAKNAAMNKAANSNNNNSANSNNSASSSSDNSKNASTDQQDDDDSDNDDDNDNEEDDDSNTDFTDEADVLNNSTTSSTSEISTKKRKFPMEVSSSSSSSSSAQIEESKAIITENSSKKIKHQQQLPQNYHADRKQFKKNGIKNGTSNNSSGSGMFASCSVDSKGRSLPSIKSVSKVQQQQLQNKSKVLKK